MKKGIDLPTSKTVKARLIERYNSCIEDMDGLVEFGTTMKLGLQDMRRRHPEWDNEDWLKVSLEIKKMLKPTMEALNHLRTDLIDRRS